MALLIIASVIIVIEAQVVQISNQEQIAWNIQSGASELNTISDNYFLYQENIQLEMWKTEFNSLSNNLTELSPANTQQSIITTIENDMKQLNTTFAQIVLFLESVPRNQSVRTLPEFQTAWTQLSDKNHALIYDSAQLTQALHAQTNQLQLSNMVLIIFLLGLFCVYFFANYFIMYRRTLKSISDLQAGITIIGLGNLNYSIKADKKDEIGALTDSFNQMTVNLRNLTASKSDLEEEIAKRKKAELQLEEYSKNLERLVEERTKQLQDKERLATIGQVAGMVGHDIRNPLQTIVSEIYFARQAIDTMPQDRVRQGALESVNTIQEQVDYISKIVSDLQDYSRALKPELIEVDLCKLIPEALKTVNVPENIDASTVCEENMPKLRLDLTFMRRILTNLVNNAIQAMPNGGKLAIKAFKKANSIIVTVEDTGVGIPDEIKPKLFTPLFTTKLKGQGFGLAVTKRLLGAQGGTISFESQTGKGTKFVIELPIK